MVSRIQVFNNEEFVSVSCFGTMIIGLKEDGTVNVKGNRDIYDVNEIDTIYADTSEWKGIIQVSAGQQHVLGLKNDGCVLVAGLEIPKQSDIEQWNDIISVDTSWFNAVGLTSEGKVKFAGNLTKDESDKIESWKNIKSVSTGGGAQGYPGSGHVVGLRNDGTVVAVGDNEYGQCNVDDWDNIVAISAGDWHTVGLKADGTVISTRPFDRKGISTISACDVDKWSDIVAISAGCGITLGLKKDGTVVSCGYNKENQRPQNNEWSNIKIYDEWE